MDPSRRFHGRGGGSSSSIAAVGGIPLVIFAIHLVGQLEGAFRFDMVGLYLVLFAAGLFAAVQPQDQRWIPQVVGAGVALTGIAAAVYPNELASPGLLGAALLLLGGFVFAAAATFPRHRMTSA